MTAPAGLLSPISGPTEAPPIIESGECSESSSYLYDTVNALWWRFTAPADGIYGFDSALCSVDGTTDEDEPFAILGASISPVWVEHVDGTSCDWAAYELTSGQVIDISITALSSLDDLVNDTLRPVDVALRSSGTASVEIIVDPPTLADLEFVGSTTAGGSGSMAYPVGSAAGDIAMIVAYSEGMSVGAEMSVDMGNGIGAISGGNIVSDTLITQTANSVITLSDIPVDPVSIDYDGGSGDATLWVFRFTDYDASAFSFGSQSRGGMIQSNSLGDPFVFGNAAYIAYPPGTHVTPQNWTVVLSEIVPEDTASVVWGSTISLGSFVSLDVDAFVPGSGFSTSDLSFTPGDWIELPGSSSSMQGFVFGGSPFFNRDVSTSSDPYATAAHNLVAVVVDPDYEYIPGDCESIFVIRQYPRDDMFGFSRSPRVFPPSKGKRPLGSKPRFVGGFD